MASRRVWARMPGIEGKVGSDTHSRNQAITLRDLLNLRVLVKEDDKVLNKGTRMVMMGKAEMLI